MDPVTESRDAACPGRATPGVPFAKGDKRGMSSVTMMSNSRTEDETEALKVNAMLAS